MTDQVEIRKMPEPSKQGIPIIRICVTGSLTREQYETLERQLQPVIAEHGSIRILLVLQELEDMTPSARSENQRFETKHIEHIDRVAVARTTRKDKEAPESVIPLTDVNTRFFPLGEMEQALEWLQQ